VTRATARVGGVKLAYYVRGAGPPVLFVMGLGGRASDWNDRFLAPLAARFTAVTFDNRGTGASDKPMEDYSLEVMADEAVGVLDACRHARAHVVGISMGGMIAQLVALRHPARVDRLVLIATHGGGPGVVPPTPEAMAALAADRTRPRAEVVRRAMPWPPSPRPASREPAAIEALVALAEAQPTPEAVFARQLAAILASRRMSRLGAITAPTLVVHGTDDPLVPPANGAALARAIPGARLVELPGCGHLPMWECPARLADVLIDFLSTEAGAERRQAARGASRAGVELGASEQRSARERASSGRAPK